MLSKNLSILFHLTGYVFSIQRGSSGQTKNNLLVFLKPRYRAILYQDIIFQLIMWVWSSEKNILNYIQVSFWNVKKTAHPSIKDSGK